MHACMYLSCLQGGGEGKRGGLLFVIAYHHL